MPNDRGGNVLKTGKIGHVNVLRQQLMAPGETINTQINGTVKLENLRERESLRIHAHLATFVTPVRWLDDTWVDYVKGGPTQPDRASRQIDYASLGVGSDSNSEDGYSMFYDSALRVYNEWYKWPELPDETFWALDGPAAVPLSHAWSRTRQNRDPSYGTSAPAPNDAIDVRALQRTQGQFESAIQRDTLSYNRYMELMQMLYNADGSREADKVPIMIDQTEVGVNPREQAASDGASLGQWQSIFNFNVDHSIRGISFPEHAILTYVLCVRFPSVSEQRNPLAWPGRPWEVLVMDEPTLANTQPQTVMSSELFVGNNNDVGFDIGYLPAGWQWRTGFDVIDYRIDSRDTFPYMKKPETFEQAKDASRINPAFVSTQLGHYLADLYFSEESRSLINTAKDSWMTGSPNADTGSGNKSEFPDGGKML